MEAPIDAGLAFDRGQVTRALIEEVTAAGGAPSIYNTQSWHWRVRGGGADLYAEPRRQPTIADPDRRLLALSRGRRPRPRLRRRPGVGCHVRVTALVSGDVGAAGSVLWWFMRSR